MEGMDEVDVTLDVVWRSFVDNTISGAYSNLAVLSLSLVVLAILTGLERGNSG